MAKRSLCLLLALATLFSLAAPAFAEEAPEPIVTEEPVEVTEEPVVEATEEPVVTEVPVEATEEPVVTEGPIVTEGPAVEATEEPVVTEEPAEVTTEPDEEEPEPLDSAGDGIAPIETVIASGMCGENVSWSFEYGGALTITGTGPMGDSTRNKPAYGVWEFGTWASQVKTVVIEKGVTSIGKYAFCYCSQLTSITIPEGVTTIGEGAFYSCGALTKLDIPASVKEIGGWALYNCVGLTSIDVAAGNTAYASSDGVLYDAGKTTVLACPAAKSGEYQILSGVKTISGAAFSDCTALTGVKIPETVTVIEANAFNNCTHLKDITIPSGMTRIENYTFSGCASLTGVTIPDGVTRIGEYAFAGCTALANVTIPESVTDILDNAFIDCVGLTIRGYDGSAAERCAKEKGYSFESLGPGFAPSATESPSPAPTTPAEPTTPAPAATDAPAAPTTPQPTATPKPAKPAAPKLLKAENVATGVKFSWNAVSGASKYLVYVKTTGNWKKLGTTTKTSCTWTKAKSGTKYTFTVIAQNSAGQSSYDKTGKSVTYVAAPTVKVALTTSGIKVSWNKCAGAGAYRVFYKTSANGKWKTIGDTTATSYTRKNAKLTSGKTYWFTVRCVKAKDSKTYVSSYNDAGVKVKFVKAPTVKVTRTSSGIKISWDKCAGAGAYRVFYKTSAKGGWKKIGDTTKTSYTMKNSKLKNGTTYWFTVRCVNAKNGKTYVSAYDTAGKSIKYKK